MDLTQKKIVVVGGSSGIGRAVAQQAFDAGSNVILTSRSKDKAAEVAKQIGTRVIGLELDVDNDESVLQLFQELSGIDHIYVAAGNTKVGRVTDGSLEENLKSFNTRLLGSLRIVRAAISKMNVGGSFVFTGGVSTDRPISGAWVAGLGTASAEQLARVLVMEFAEVRFNSVSPGYTDTPMWDAIMGENKSKILQEVAQKIPVKKVATPAEVASAVIFLMSNPSVNGEVIHVDGGSRLI